MKVSISKIKERIVSGDLGEALRMLDETISSHMEWGISDSLKRLTDSYDFMLSSIENGMNDPKFEENFHHLNVEAYRLLAKVKWHIRSNQNKSFITVYGEDPVFDVDYCKTTLENLYADELIGQGDVRRHQSYINKVFTSLTNQELWTDETAQKMEALLLSPTIDLKDRLMITTAVMLSAAGTFDMLKLLVLFHVYQQAEEEELRVRALVGWVMSTDVEMLPLYNEQSRILDAYINDERTQDDLYALQLQLIHCVNALQDNRAIRDEILPELVKNQGIPDIDIRIIENPDEIEDFEEREAAEDKIDAIQEKVEQMMDMQRQGSDIYFGGFSAMKRYPFFNTIPNWFCPFYIEHPELEGIFKADVSPKVVSALLNAVPFCDSDKYSFALTIDVVLQKIPKQMLDLLGTGELKSMEEFAQLPKFAILLRNYLQDLFRFFRLCPMNSKFVNIFDKDKSLFIVSRLFANNDFIAKTANIARMLLKKGNNDYFQYFIENNEHVTQELLGICANYYYREEKYSDAQILYTELLSMNPQSKTAARGLAKISFVFRDYKEALRMYELFDSLSPGKISTKMNIALCKAQTGNTDEAIKIMAKLNYENPDRGDIVSNLAWVYLASKNTDAAIRQYQKVLELDDADTYDNFRLGFAYLCAGNMAKAAEEMAKDFPANSTYDNIRLAIDEECSDVAGIYNFPPTTISTLADLIYKKLIA